LDNKKKRRKVMKAKANNPILPGFNPDPSICRVGDDYYIVNSSFGYFPGLPIYHSRDLAHWEQIGNVLDRTSQLPLEKAGVSAGLFAPTIRYYDGTFYCICTNTSYGGNFIVKSKEITGPWSEPVYIKGADGIDPSLFFDDDGRCYYIGTHEREGGAKYNGDWFIYIREIDKETCQFVGQGQNVWNGAMRHCIWPEGPHLYKKEGYYYIMHAEGGTSTDHSECIVRSKEIFGPYEHYPRNPILTHRHLGKMYPIQNVGHADLVETPNHDWYLVTLAVRPLEGYTTLGRETFIAKVEWEDGWPVVNPGIGRLTDSLEINLQETPLPEREFIYDFTKMKELGTEFLTLRNHDEPFYEIDNTGLTIKLSSNDITKEEQVSYIAIRQLHHTFTVETDIKVSSLDRDVNAGLVLFQNNLYHLKIECRNQDIVSLICQKGKNQVISMFSYRDYVKDGKLNLKIKVDGLKAELEAGGRSLGTADIRELSTEVADGFVGCTTGIYGFGNPDKTVTFTRLEYRP